jgi:hypothetical protein
MAHTKAPTIIRPCTYSHNYQDSKFGKGLRLHNPYMETKGVVGYRCTVCGINPKKPWNFPYGVLVISPTYAKAVDDFKRAGAK